MNHLQGKTLLLLGDSIMYGSGNDGYGVGEYLRDGLGLRLYKYAVGGARVGFQPGKSWVIDQARQAIADGVQPDYIVFDGFTNDCNKTDGVHADVELGEITEGYEGFNIACVQPQGSTFTRCFEELLHALLVHFPAAKVLFIRPHNMGRRENGIQKVYGERALVLCEKWGVPYVDLYRESGLNTFLPAHRDAFTCDSYGWGRGDCTHPNAQGYQLKYMPLITAKILRI